MTTEEFNQEWSEFIKEFNQSFDTSENREAIKNVVVQNSEKESDIPLNYEHIYQEQRTNNLVKVALIHFLHLDEKN